MSQKSDETRKVFLCTLQAGAVKTNVYQYFPTKRIEFVADCDICVKP